MNVCTSKFFESIITARVSINKASQGFFDEVVNRVNSNCGKCLHVYDTLLISQAILCLNIMILKIRL